MRESIKNNVLWCLKQKNGLSLTQPSGNLCKAYLKKAENSITSMNANFNVDVLDWAVVAAYYARYFSVYALLRKCGIKCEIHDCTIKAFNYLFVKEGIASPDLLRELGLSKERRTDVQYYIQKNIDKRLTESDIKSAKAFLLEIEDN